MLDLLKKRSGMIFMEDGGNLPPIIYYHRVAPKADPDTGVTPEMFDQQMRTLHGLGFRGVSIELLLNSKGQDSQGMIGITFDDGYQDNYEWAAPILERYGFRATIFCVSQKLGELTEWADDPRWIGHRLMTGGEARELSKKGFEIGAHSRTHPDLTSLTGKMLDEEIRGSREDLQDILGLSVPNFCYPYGRFNEESKESARRAGFVSARSTRRMRPGKPEDPFDLPARSISGEMSLPRFILTVTGYRLVEKTRLPVSSRLFSGGLEMAEIKE